jgi:hypothetical protein
MVATTAIILGGVLLPLQFARVACCALPRPSSQLAQDGQGTAAAASTPEIALLFYYFQLNGTTGNLLFVMQNIGRLNTSVANVYYDGSPVNSSLLTSSDICAAFLIGLECRMTMAFGPESLLPPVQGSVHSLEIQTAGGGRFDYSVIAGTSRADCGLAHC